MFSELWCDRLSHAYGMNIENNLLLIQSYRKRQFFRCLLYLLLMEMSSTPARSHGLTAVRWRQWGELLWNREATLVNLERALFAKTEHLWSTCSSFGRASFEFKRADLKIKYVRRVHILCKQTFDSLKQTRFPLKMDIAEDARYLKRYLKTVLYVGFWWMSILQRWGDMLATYVLVRTFRYIRMDV